MAKLNTGIIITIQDLEKTSRQMVGGSSFFIGRALDAQFCLSHPEISRLHLKISIRNEKIFIEDQNSSNGTFLNGEKLGSKLETEISPNDIVTLGRAPYKFSFEIINKIFEIKDIKSSQLSQQEKSDLTDLIKRVQNEAAEIIHQAKIQKEEILGYAQLSLQKGQSEVADILKSAQEAAENIINEARKYALDQAEKMQQEACEQVLQKANHTAKGLIETAEDEKAKMLQNAENLAESIRQEAKVRADEEAKQKLFDLKESLQKRMNEEADLIISEARIRSEKMINEAQELAQLTNSAAVLNAEDIISSAQRACEKLKHTVDGLSLEESNLMESLKVLQKELKSAEEEVRNADFQFQSLTKESNRLALEKDNLSQLVLDLRIEVRDREISKINLEKQIRELDQRLTHSAEELNNRERLYLENIQEFDRRLAAARGEFEIELEALKVRQQKEIDELSRDAIEVLERRKKDYIERIRNDKRVLIAEILQRVSFNFATTVSEGSLQKIEKVLSEEIENILSKYSMNLEAESNFQVTHQKGTSISKGILSNRHFQVVSGVILGAIGMYIVGQLWLDENKTISTIHDTLADSIPMPEIKKFSPNQDTNLRDNYTDSVIYTKLFAEIYLNPEVQKKWQVEAMDYLLKNWRVDEEKTIQVLAKLNSLVENLEVYKANINPDFVTQGVEKMHKLEQERISEIAQLLGTQVKLEALKKFERKFFEAELMSRAPAQE